MAADGHHKGACVGGVHLKGRRITGHRVGIARHHVQDGGVGGVGLGIHQPLPGIDEITGGDLLAVRPVDVAAEGEGIGLGAVHVVLVGIGGRLTGGQGAGGAGFHKVFEELGGHGFFRFGDGPGGIQRVGRAHQRGPDGHMVRLRLAAGCQRQRHAQRQHQR